MYKKDIDFLKSTEISYAEFTEEGNRVIVETAGFVPLEVKFKRFEQNGMVASFNASEFTSQDYRDMYLNPEFEISPEDDMEEAFEKLRMQQEFINNLTLERSKTSDISGGNSEVAPQGLNKKKTEETEETPKEE